MVHHRVLYLVSDSHGPQSSFLSHFLKLDEQIVNFLLYQDCLDSRLASACEVLPPAGAPVDLSLSPRRPPCLSWLLRLGRATGH